MHIAIQPAESNKDSMLKFVKRYVNLLMLVFPVISFLIIPSIPGTTIITFFAGILCIIIFLTPLGLPKQKFIKELFIFFSIITVLSICSQMVNLWVDLKLPDDLLLLNIKNYTQTFFRISHLTQTLSLIVGFTIYLYIKYFADEKTLTYVFWGVRLMCIYGIYELLYYMIFHQNGDFIVNRTFGYENKPASQFQTMNMGGISLIRMTSYTGEPSMFVFTAYPFWVLAVALKRKFDSVLILGCLLLTFSTTAYLAILIFSAFWMIYKQEFHLIFYGLVGLAAFCIILQLDVFSHQLDSIYKIVFASKLDGSSASSKDRSGHFTTHITYWANLNIYNEIVGIGFGYVRSTDFFSTVMVNNGVIGFLLFTSFFYDKLSFKIKPEQVQLSYRIGLVLLYIILMTTVPEFAYPSLWIFLGLGYVLSADNKKELFKSSISIRTRDLKLINN
jgi:hypothetical protein